MHALTSTRGARRTMHWFWAMAALLAVWASAWPVQAQQAPGQWGLRLLATHVLSPEAVALVVGADGKVAQRVLKTGDAIGDRWVVNDGLKAGDRVIVEGVQKVQVGMPVKAVEAGVPAADGSAPAPTSTPATKPVAAKAG